MDLATVVYSRSFTLGTPILRHADRWGRWSHCGIVTPDQRVLEARAFHPVTDTTWEAFEKRTTYRETVDIEVPNLEDGLKWAWEQKGKSYDYKAIFGNLFRESWQSPDKWHCAEFVEMFLAKCGRPRFRQETWRISPNNSWSVL